MSEPLGTREADAEAHAHSHGDVSGGWLRAAVFGAMDGLVSNTALVAGIGGAGASSRIVVLTGTAGLIAGAISMALGEFTSVKTQNEQLEREVAKERHELEHNAASEQAELAELMVARGVEEELAHEVAGQLSRDREVALRIHILAELGLNPEETPSPWVAAGSSFLTFSVGAVFPLLPYLFGFPLLWLALLSGAIGLVVAGVLSSLFTRRPWWFGGLEKLLFGVTAAGATYLIGAAIGVTAT